MYPRQMKRILVLGGGFAGLWSAVGAARKLDALGIGPNEIEVVLVDRHPYHNIRVRNYEDDLGDVCVPFDDVLAPIGIGHIAAIVREVDFEGQQIHIDVKGTDRELLYDRLVFSLGSALHRPNLPGLAAHGFDVDTYDSAARLRAHLAALRGMPSTLARNTVVVVGAGLTGIEVACEMPHRVASALGETTPSPKVILLDSNASVGSDMGHHARPIIEEALRSLDIETKLGACIAAVDGSGVTLASGEHIASATIIWCAGMRANVLTGRAPVEKDRLGRIPVDAFMRVQGVQNAFAAGDAAWCMMDDVHRSVMSCQDGRPMGRFAGHNVVADLVGEPMLPLRIESYVTVLDLGPWGALYTTGRDRSVASTGAAARATKRLINRQRIYPPRSQRDSHRRGAAGAECALRVQVIAAGSAMHDDNTY